MHIYIFKKNYYHFHFECGNNNDDDDAEQARLI